AAAGGAGQISVQGREAAAESAAPEAAKTFAVGLRNITLVDTTRPTPANRGAPELPSRTLRTSVYYPAPPVLGDGVFPDAPAAVKSGPFPLLVFAHGFGADGPTYGFLLSQIARQGYVVAAPTFPLSSAGAAGGPNLADYVNQPADVSFVIDEMLRLDRDRLSPFSYLIARRHIGVAGHSLGAITTLGLLNTCCIDPRIDAVVPISGIQLPFPGGSFTYAQKTPILLIHGDADGTVPYAGSQQVYAAARRPKYLLTLLGAGHVPFFGAGGEVLVDSMVHFLDAYLDENDRALARLKAGGSVPGVSRLDSSPK
ncbi:MAG: hypothetical protein WKF43_17700, partial [Acidimicrobiales bacterium]